MPVTDRFADYDLLAKRDSESWNDATRAAIDRRLALKVKPGVLSGTQLATLRKLVARVCPNPLGHGRTTTVELIALRIEKDAGEGYRHHALPRFAECWRRALDALEAEARERHSVGFAALKDRDADALLRAVEAGEVRSSVWASIPPAIVWAWRLLPDLVAAHWAQPALWSAMGFGGPASPRGYVRLGRNRRDPWEAIEEGEPLAGLPRHRG
jgi:hypothetical protein